MHLFTSDIEFTIETYLWKLERIQTHVWIKGLEPGRKGGAVGVPKVER